MVNWKIDNGKLNIQGIEDFEEQIEYAKSSLQYKKIEIVLKNDKHYMLHLDEYGYEGHGNDIPEECRISRTKFIHWARDVKRIPIVSKDSATTSFDEIIENEGELDAEDAVQSINVNKPNTANGSVERNVHVSPVTEIKKDNGSVGLNSPLDQSVIEPTVQTAEKNDHTVESMNAPDTQGNTNPMVMSEDEPAIELAIGTIDAVGDDNINPELESGETNCDKEASIESNEEENCREGMDNPIKNLIGRNIKVHIQNLVEPAKERKTRELDTEHVTALEEQFKKELNLYTVLIGHMPEKLELDQLEIPGRAVVEVLGGNHTRQALMNIGKTNMLVSMDLYMSLSNEQALRLGLKHNDIHRLSRQTTFEESIKLFREVLFRIKKQKPHMKPKDISAEWRLNVASIMDTPKSKINKFQTHLHCASLPDQVWEKLIDLFKSWRNQTVKNQPCYEIKQTHLFHLFRVHNEVDKIRLLDELACGKTTFQEFKDQCLKGKVENMAVSHTIKKTKGQKKKSKAVDNTPLKEDDVLRDNLITEILELKKKIKQDEMATVNMKLRHDNLEKNNRELENKYTAELTQNESMQHQIKNLTDSLSSMEKKNKNLTEELDMAKDIYKTEKKKSDDVERNITHALNETEKKQSDKIYQLQEHIKEKDLKIESLHLQLNMVNDAANRARNEVREIAKKRPHEITEDTEDVRPDTQTKKMKATTDAITVSEETIDISQNKEIAMVEYNNENVYLGVLQDSMLTFTRQPLGKLGPDFVIKDLNFSLNKKDRQLINSAYIIENIKCKIVKNKFTIDEEQKKDLENSVKKYLAGKNTKNVASNDSLKTNGE